MTHVDLTQLTPCPDIVGEDDEETRLLHQMHEEAMSFLQSQPWCPTVAECYLAYGVGQVVALFLFCLDQPIQDKDDCLWVVVGDLPSAYFVTDQARDAHSALGVYCSLMDDWCNAAASGRGLQSVYPVRVPATQANVDALRKRIAFIRNELLPNV